MTSNVEDVTAARRHRRSALIDDYQTAHAERVDCVLAMLLVGQWIATVAGALWVGPAAWGGTGVDAGNQAVMAIILGSVVAAAAALLVWKRPGAVTTRHTVAAAQIVFSCLLLHLTAGRPSMQFHLFGSMAFLALYRDWRVLVTATVVVIIDHVTRGLWFPLSLYGTVTPDYLRSFELLAWLLFEMGFLYLGCRFAERDVRELADQAEAGERALEIVAEEVRLQTADAIREAEVMKVAAAVQSRFLANISTTIRKPMDGLESVVQAVLQSDLDPGQRAQVELVQTATVALGNSLQDFQAIAQLRAGSAPATRPVTLRRVISDVVQLNGLVARQRGIELMSDVHADVPRVVLTDEAWLRHALMTVISNVLHAAEGDVFVGVEPRCGNDEGLQLAVLIAERRAGDHSPRSEDLDWNDQTTTPRQDLVPAVVRELVQTLGGGLRETSRLGERAAVELVLTCLRARTDSLDPEVPEELADRRVLIIDDSPSNLSILANLVSQCGMIPETASDGRQGLQLIIEAHERCEPIAFVLCDAHMPEMDGARVAEEIRKLRRNGRTGAEVLLLTSAGGEVPADLLACGTLSGCLMKPLSEDALLRGLERAAQTAARRSEESTDAGQSGPDKPRYFRRPNGPLRILLAEDNLLNQQLMLRVLERDGHTVLLAENGHEACQVAAAEVPDIALIDAEMPEMDGREAIAAIRGSDGEEYSMPVIGLVSRTRPEDAAGCVDAGMDAIVSKPIRIDELSHVMAVLVERGSRFAGQRAAAPNTEPPEAEELLPVLDRSALLPRVGGDAEFLDLLAVMFREDCPKRLAEIQNGLSADDFPMVRNAAHAVRGTTANVGATRASAEAKRLTDFAENSCREECVVSAIELDRTLKETYELLDELISELQAGVA